MRVSECQWSCVKVWQSVKCVACFSSAARCAGVCPLSTMPGSHCFLLSLTHCSVLCSLWLPSESLVCYVVNSAFRGITSQYSLIAVCHCGLTHLGGWPCKNQPFDFPCLISVTDLIVICNTVCWYLCAYVQRACTYAEDDSLILWLGIQPLLWLVIVPNLVIVQADVSRHRMQTLPLLPFSLSGQELLDKPTYPPILHLILCGQTGSEKMCIFEEKINK